MKSPNITNQRKVDRQWIYWYRNKEDRETLSNFLEQAAFRQRQFVYDRSARQAPRCGIGSSETQITVGLHMAAGA